MKGRRSKANRPGRRREELTERDCKPLGSTAPKQTCPPRLVAALTHTTQIYTHTHTHYVPAHPLVGLGRFSLSDEVDDWSLGKKVHNLMLPSSHKVLKIAA